MKVLEPKHTKSNILDLMDCTKEYLLISTFSFDITNFELFEFIQLIERGVEIDIVGGKELPVNDCNKLSMLYNIAVYYLPTLHSKVYLNESEAIVTSCNFGNLTVPRFFECGVRFSKREFRLEHERLKSQVLSLISDAQQVLPRIPKANDKGIDFKDFL